MSSPRPILAPINYSCHYTQSRDGEQFARIHTLGIILSGSMQLDDGHKKMQFNKGDLFSSRKDNLIRFVKRPPLGGEFKSMSILFDEETLRDFAQEHGYKVERRAEAEAFIALPQEPSLLAFMHSLIAYETIPNAAELLRLKQREALLLLLSYDLTLKDILFDFSPPEKIDLERFMQKNFHFNVKLERFAYLTGRSLSTFKRDFEKIFHQTPSRWLLHRRLQEAYRLIREKGMQASDIYLDLGFEDLSHFSFTFKKEFGLAPSRLERDISAKG